MSRASTKPKLVKTRTTEAPPLIRTITTFQIPSEAETKGSHLTLGRLVLPMALWFTTFLCLAGFGCLLIPYRNYLPTYTPNGQTTFLPPLKPL
ncbi:hypothetical protein Q5P01_002872 [Channa striata]|uniref:Uncharacterized protein n=1 Tax=Channa striata TaxID=64152 RepID=A0AA88NSE3_CHASR|nr:hypothetical protein Q5P01_002872 [Channa striata]